MSEIETLQKQALIILLKAEILTHLIVEENYQKETFDVEWVSYYNEKIMHNITIKVLFMFDEVVTPETFTHRKVIEWTNKRFQIISVDSSLNIGKYDLENELTDVLMQW